MTEHELRQPDLEKIVIELSGDLWHGYSTESVWAQRDPSGEFTVRNVPFYAKGISFGDRVAVRKKEGLLVYRKTKAPSGHSTYRVVTAEGRRFEEVWQRLEALGCTYEKATERLFAIDVPSDVDIYAVYSALEQGEREGSWEFEEGHCGHRLRR